MHKVLALYPPPKDPAHFKRYYEETHLPLAGQLPGLLSSRYSFSIEGSGSPSPYFCIWEGEFASEAAMGAAMQSPVGQRVAADVANYATGGVTIVHFDVKAPAHRPSSAKQTAGNPDTFTEGLQVRRDMFGPAASDQVLESATDFNRPLQDIVTRYCFGEVWTRPLLDRKTRSMLTMAMLVALNKPNQLKGHVRGAIKNGLTKEHIREVLLHSMIYCGVPAGVDSFNHATEVLKDMGLE
ncbi:MAG TPA: EthD family reductase [Candidatus Acidoferrales bacterium]|nr:EthD family reductase [Candidatus Acidoferrales bacterium]